MLTNGIGLRRQSYVVEYRRVDRPFIIPFRVSGELQGLNIVLLERGCQLKARRNRLTAVSGK